MNHTPGPWRAERHGYTYYVRSADAIVTELSMEGKPMERSKANALLISAAPDLLQTLAELLGALEVDAMDDKSNVYRSLMIRAKFAIHKASGEQI